MILFSKDFHLDPEDPMSYGAASSSFKKTLKQLGIPSETIKRTAIAMYEAEINTIIHGGGGTGSVKIEDDYILITFIDEGPGIPDVDLAMQEGYTTASAEIREMGFGAGLGLPNILKNSNHLDIESEEGKGTRVSIRIDL